jgi:ArsR family transcriptional regulator
LTRPLVHIYAYAHMTTTLSTTPDLFRAFADPTRLRLLNLLLEGECCVCDLCTVLDEIQPKVSRHLAYLRRAGLVTVRTEGKWKHYAITRHAEGLHRTLLNCVRSCLREMEELQADLTRLKATAPGTSCPDGGNER